MYRCDLCCNKTKSAHPSLVALSPTLAQCDKIPPTHLAACNCCASPCSCCSSCRQVGCLDFCPTSPTTAPSPALPIKVPHKTPGNVWQQSVINPTLKHQDLATRSPWYSGSGCFSPAFSARLSHSHTPPPAASPLIHTGRGAVQRSAEKWKIFHYLLLPAAASACCVNTQTDNSCFHNCAASCRHYVAPYALCLDGVSPPTHLAASNCCASPWYCCSSCWCTSCVVFSRLAFSLLVSLRFFSVSMNLWKCRAWPSCKTFS